MATPLSRYVGRRLLIIVPQVLVVSSAVFVLMRLLPADPAVRLVGTVATPEAFEEARQTLGLDQPIIDQYWGFLRGLLRGDLGSSWVSAESVTQEIAAHLPITIQLIVMTFGIALAFSVAVGMIAATNPGGRFDRGVFLYSLFAGGQPNFWWALMFIFLFVITFEIFPFPTGLLARGIPPPPTFTGFGLIDSLIAGRFDAFWSMLGHLLLPSLSLAFTMNGPIVKMIRQNMQVVLDSDFVTYARAAGLPRRRVAAYTMRNAFTPAITVVGILFAFSLGGAVLIENVFSLNGLGQYAVQRTLALDFPAIQGVVLVMTGFALIVYLATDILYAAIDPRIRY